jgi:flagellar basal body-associated protein FliL
VATYQSNEPGAPAPRSGGSGFLYFVVGALVVAVAVLAFMYFQGQSQPEGSIERGAEAISEAADDISDSVRDAARNIPPPADPAPAPAAPTLPPG